MVDLDEYYDDVTKIDLEFGSDEEEKEFLGTIDLAAKGKFVSRGEFIRHALREQLKNMEEDKPSPPEDNLIREDKDKPE
ncbi:MAG TPA: ribbon-helix-helix domain-containing protein [Candidatus Dojkabacteria bacterium]